MTVDFIVVDIISISYKNIIVNKVINKVWERGEIAAMKSNMKNNMSSQFT